MKFVLFFEKTKVENLIIKKKTLVFKIDEENKYKLIIMELFRKGFK